MNIEQLRLAVAGYERRRGYSAFADEIMSGQHDALITELNPWARDTEAVIAAEGCLHHNGYIGNALLSWCPGCGHCLIDPRHEANLRVVFDHFMSEAVWATAILLQCAFIKGGELIYRSARSNDLTGLTAQMPLSIVWSSCIGAECTVNEHMAALRAMYNFHSIVRNHPDVPSLTEALRQERKEISLTKDHNVPMSNLTYVAYYRVSTESQGADGLGVEAQMASVQAYLLRYGGTVLKEFTEVESGRKGRFDGDRPVLKRAMDECRSKGAVLLVAKLDRLTRNIGLLQDIRDAGVQFRACDNPDANELMINILVSFAQEEARLISLRTKAGLKVIKDNIATKGFHVSKAGNTITALGRSEMDPKHRKMGTDANRQRMFSNPNNIKAYALIEALTRDALYGRIDWTQIAVDLNKAGYKTSTGRQFSRQCARGLYQRMKGR